MWIKSKIARAQRKNKSHEASYITLNTKDGNPAIRVSEKAKLELGWDKGDFVNIFINKEKIVLMRDNETKEFPVCVYKNDKTSYGFNLYGKAIRDVIESTDWETKIMYPAQIEDVDGQKALYCFRDEVIRARAEMAFAYHRQGQGVKI